MCIQLQQTWLEPFYIALFPCSMLCIYLALISPFQQLHCIYTSKRNADAYINLEFPFFSTKYWKLHDATNIFILIYLINDLLVLLAYTWQ